MIDTHMKRSIRFPCMQELFINNICQMLTCEALKLLAILPTFIDQVHQFLPEQKLPRFRSSVQHTDAKNDSAIAYAAPL